jgi:hypothetical protein
MRKFGNYRSSEVQDSDDLDLDDEKLLHRIDTLLNRKSDSYTQEIPYQIDQASPVKLTTQEFDEKNNAVHDIAHILGSLSLEEKTMSVKKKTPIKFDGPITSISKQPMKTVVGVPMNAREDGSTVTVLTPVRAKKKYVKGWNH